MKKPQPLSPGTRNRKAPLEMTGDEFRELGHRLVDQIAEFFDSLPQRPVTSGLSAREARELLSPDELPRSGSPAAALLDEVATLLMEHSLFNGHPRFWGYITASAAPIGALADLLAGAVNPNVGAEILSPIATEIEAQTIRWIAELIGFPRSCGGLLVSGGNAANFVCFLAARQAHAPWDLKTEGLHTDHPRLVAYVSEETHTWIDKAAELFGMGRKSIRWIRTDSRQRMDLAALERAIRADRKSGHHPFLVVGTAGTTGTGTTDPLPEIAALCRNHKLWFHVDGAYGAPAAALPDAPPYLLGLRQADSIALDPHKWLYSPLEAGCALVRNPLQLLDTFSHKPAYYHFEGNADDPPLNYFEYGLQNSRGFRALKVWLGLRQVGREGYLRMISDDIALARALFQRVDHQPELQAFTLNLSIATFRFVPSDLPEQAEATEPYLNELNEELLNRLQRGGAVFVSNASVGGRYLLRACIVNFRTDLTDVEALPALVVEVGRQIDAELRPDSLRAQ